MKTSPMKLRQSLPVKPSLVYSLVLTRYPDMLQPCCFFILSSPFISADGLHPSPATCCFARPGPPQLCQCAAIPTYNTLLNDLLCLPMDGLESTYTHMHTCLPWSEMNQTSRGRRICPQIRRRLSVNFAFGKPLLSVHWLLLCPMWHHSRWKIEQNVVHNT